MKLRGATAVAEAALRTARLAHPQRLRRPIICQYLNAACKTPLSSAHIPEHDSPAPLPSSLCFYFPLPFSRSSPPLPLPRLRSFFSIRKGRVRPHTSELCGAPVRETILPMLAPRRKTGEKEWIERDNRRRARDDGRRRSSERKREDYRFLDSPSSLGERERERKRRRRKRTRRRRKRKRTFALEKTTRNS